MIFIDRDSRLRNVYSFRLNKNFSLKFIVSFANRQNNQNEKSTTCIVYTINDHIFWKLKLKLKFQRLNSITTIFAKIKTKCLTL